VIKTCGFGRNFQVQSLFYPVEDDYVLPPYHVVRVARGHTFGLTIIP